jgi:phosphoribosyl 1,2-cyclic phosphodiesterase
VLLEAGLPASKLARFLFGLHCDPRTLHGILLTHAHSDHLHGARELSDRYGIPIYATAGTLGHRSLRDSALAQVLVAGQVLELEDLAITPFRVPHDCVEPVGFRIEGADASVCLATDLGFVPEQVRPHLEGVDLLVLESNHDEETLWNGRYPAFLKRRVAGELGHLSNVAASRCLADLHRRPPGAVWLAHLSLINNRPQTAVQQVGATLRAVGLGEVPVEAAGRNRPTLSWQAEPPARQLPLL